MNILRNIKVPTGNIIVGETSNGKLEFLSLGDYGKEVNLNQHMKVEDGTPIMPLSEKWVLTLSTQFRCAMGCTFCDVPKVKHVGKINIPYMDMVDEIRTALSLHPEITHTERLNIHFARMGEPTFNRDVLVLALNLQEVCAFQFNGDSLIHPVISTMMPKGNMFLEEFLIDWMNIKNNVYDGGAGLQLSINSTDDDERNLMFNNNAMSIGDISLMMEKIVKLFPPLGRKITLNFAVAGYTVDAHKLACLFDTEHFICKITPMHKTASAIEKNIKTEGDYTSYYPYLELEQSLKDAGFETLTFIASHEEDMGRITCGNAILSGTEPEI